MFNYQIPVHSLHCLYIPPPQHLLQGTIFTSVSVYPMRLWVPWRMVLKLFIQVFHRVLAWCSAHNKLLNICWMNKWVKGEGERLSSLCRIISKPKGRMCRNQIGKGREPGTRAKFPGAARGAVMEESLLLLHNSLKPREGMSKGRDDNLSPSGPWFKHKTQKGTMDCIKPFKAPSLRPLGLCLSSVRSKTGR